MTKLVSVFAFVVSLGLLLGGQAGDALGQVEVNLAITSEPTTLDPQKTFDGGERRVTDNIYEKLLERDQNMNLRPALAAAMPRRIAEKTWEFKLRPGIKFHNGEPLNAEAVAFSVNRIMNPEYKSRQVGDLRGIDRAEAIDELTVHIHTKRLDTLLPARMYLLKIVPPKAAQREDFAEAPVGTGPFKFVSWEKGRQIVLERNEGYWREKPVITKATFRFVTEAGSAFAGLLAGEFDFVDNLQAEYVERAPNEAHRAGLEHPFAIISAVSGPTKDIRVRQALNYAVDKKALADSLFLGYASPAHGQMIGDRSFGYNPALDPWPYDPQKAKDLLREAGASNATIEFVAPSGRWVKSKEMAEAIAGYWQAVGLDVDLKVLEFGQYLKRLRDPDVRPDVIYASHNNALMEAERTVANFYRSRAKGAASSSVADPMLDQWIEQAAAEPDASKREALYHQIMQRGYDQAYFLFLLNTHDVFGLSKRISYEPRLDNKIYLKDFVVN